jgi:parvulin-like peptidyl-prolyl isomerase
MAIAKLQDKMSIVKPPTDREISEYFNRNQEQFTLGKGIYLSEIVVDAADNKAKNDAIGEEQAKQKIDQIYTQLKNGADFATVARVQSEDVSSYKGGDLGFLDEAHLQQVGFPAQLVQAFFAMKEGDITPPVQGSKGRWYIFKLTAKRTQEEKLSLDSPDVKAKISQVLIAQRKEILNSALVSAALNQTRIENFLAQRMLQNPDNFGSLRPTSLPSVAKSDAKTETKSDAKPDAKSDAKPDAKASEDVNKDAKDSGKDAKPAGK